MRFLEMSPKFRCIHPTVVFFCLIFLCSLISATYSREVHVGLKSGYFGLGRVYTEEPILASSAFEFPPNTSAWSHGSAPYGPDDAFLPVSGPVHGSQNSVNFTRRNYSSGIASTWCACLASHLVGNSSYMDASAYPESVKGKIIALSFDEILHQIRKGVNPMTLALTASSAGALAVLYTIPALDISFTINNSIFNTVVRTNLPLIWITPTAYQRIYEHRDNLTLTILSPSSAKVFQYSRESLYSLNAFTSLIFFWAIILLASLFSVVTRVILRVRKLINNNDRLLVASALLLCLFSTYLIYALSDVFGGRGQLAYIVTGASHILLLSSGCLSPLMLVTVWWASLWNDSDQFFVSQKNMTRIIAALLCAMWCVTVIQHITETKGLYGPPTFVIMILLMVACSVLAVYFGIKFARRLREASKMTAENGFSRDKKWAKQLTSAIRKTGFVVAMMATAFVLVFPVVIAGMSTTITLFFAVFLLHLLALTICFVMLIVIIPPFSKLWQQKQ